MSDRLTELTCRYLDRVITHDEFAELDAMIARDPEAAATFRALSVQSRILSEPLRDRIQQLADAGTTPADPAPRIATRARETSSGRASAIIAIAATIVMAGGALAVYLLAFADDPAPKPPDRAPAGPPVATLIDATTDVLVGEHLARSGGEYSAGTFSIETGQAEFLLTNRVGVNLYGNTQLDVHSPMNTTLTRGSVAFNCPAGTEGFTVNLPRGAKVVDLGTRFSIDLAPDGRGLVRVIEGAVETTDGDSTHRVEGPADAIVYTETISDPDGDERQVTRILPVQVMPNPLIVSVSSEFPSPDGQFAIEHLFDDVLNPPRSDWAGLGTGPHTLVVDFGKPVTIAAIRFANRRDGPAGGLAPEHVGSIDLAFSNDPAFTDAAAVRVDQVRADEGLHQYSIEPQTGRYVRLVFTGTGAGNPGGSKLAFVGARPAPDAPETPTQP